MTVVLAPPAPSRFAWHIDSLTRAEGIAEVQRGDDWVHIMVADAGPVPHQGHGGVHAVRRVSAHASDCPDTTEAWLYGDGRVVVRSHAAPPALLITPSGSRLLPAPPEDECAVETEDGDILVMCSAEALGHLPTGLGGVLACSPLRVGAHDPEGLLEQLMEQSEFGSALIARCTPRSSPETSGTPRTMEEPR